jgi:peroxiredoxin
VDYWRFIEVLTATKGSPYTAEYFGDLVLIENTRQRRHQTWKTGRCKKNISSIHYTMVNIKHMKTILFICFSLLVGYVTCADPGKDQNKSKSVRIRLKMTDARKCDTISLFFYQQYFGKYQEAFVPSFYLSAEMDSLGFFNFTIDNVNGFGYVTLARGRTAKYYAAFAKFLDAYLVEPGDDIEIVMGPLKPNNPKQLYYWYITTAEFKGRGAEKYNYQLQCEKKAYLRNFPVVNRKLVPLSDKIEHSRKLIQNQLQYLDTVKSRKIRMLSNFRLSQKAKAILLTNALAEYQIEYAKLLFDPRIMRAETTESRAMKLPYRINFLKMALTPASEFGALFSKNYPEAVIFKSAAKFYMMTAAQQSLTSIYQIVQGKVKGKLREKCLTIYLLTNHDRIDSSDKVFEEALLDIKDPLYRNLLTAIKETVTPGTWAPDFTLPDDKGRFVKLSDYKGKVIFIDFWYTGCGHCAEYYQFQLSKVEEEYKSNQDVVFITISIDSNKELWLKSLQNGTYTSDQAINLYTNGIGAEHDVVKRYKVVSYPRPILIGRDGKIFYSNRTDLRNKETLSKIINNALIANADPIVTIPVSR